VGVWLKKRDLMIFTKILSLIKNYHRQILWITLGLLFFLDIITTTIGLEKGGFEQTPFMIPFVNNPVLHVIVKFIAFFIAYRLIEPFLRNLNTNITEETSKFNKLCYAITYSVIILALIWLIGLYLSININNIVFIISRY
jgi:hypothetical protein